MTQKAPRSKNSVKFFGKVLAYDLGGTKVAVGVVDGHGRVLEEIRVPVAIQQGKTALLRQLSDLGGELLSRHKGIRRVGVASAGPLDPPKGVLLDPTNFASGGKPWGRFAIAPLLSARLKRKVHLENDAAAAILAEAWIGAARRYEDAMILTLGTGLGVGVVIDGRLVRSGQGMHPEGGHMIVNHDDPTAPCGCGNQGCAEAYLSGRNFGKRAAVRLGQPGLSAEEAANLARAGDARALALFEEYAEVLAVVLHNFAVLYGPRMIVFTGSFAFAADLFLDPARRKLERLLARRRVGVDLMPRLAVSHLENQAGLIGGAYVAFTR